MRDISSAADISKTFGSTVASRTRHVSSVVSHAGDWLSTECATYFARGTERSWEYVHRATRAPDTDVDGVDILALASDAEGRKAVALVAQYRAAIRKVSIELPAGLVDAGETPNDAALRELREETGLVPGDAKISMSPTLALNPSQSSETSILVEIEFSLANSKFMETDFDDAEDIEMELVYVHELPALLQHLAKRPEIAIDAKLWYYARALQLAERRA